jgi:endonuclease G
VKAQRNGRGFRLPSGLRFGTETKRQLEAHLVDDPEKLTHGVFAGGYDYALSVLDAAYRRIQADDASVRQEEGKGGTGYVVDLGRRIGFMRGKLGDYHGKPGTRYVRLVLDGDRLVSAVPYLPARHHMKVYQWPSRDMRGGRITHAERLELVESAVRNRTERLRQWKEYARENGLVTQNARGQLEHPWPPTWDLSASRNKPWRGLRRGRAAHPKEPLTALQMAEELVARGATQAHAERAADEVRFGLLTDPRVGDKLDHLIVAKDSVTSYNSERNVLNWRAWRVTRDHVSDGDLARPNDFRPDQSLPRGFLRISPDIYFASGYTKGHIARRRERERSARDTSRTFVTTNVLPQVERNNGGPWLAFEDYYLNLARKGHEVYVMAGPAFAKRDARVLRMDSPHGPVDLAVPDSTWKVAVIFPPGERSLDKARVIAIDIPNRSHEVRKDAPWTDFRVTPAHIEGLTRDLGIRFFRALPEGIATRWRNHLDSGPVSKDESISRFAYE